VIWIRLGKSVLAALLGMSRVRQISSDYILTTTRFQSEEATVTQRNPEGLPKTTYWKASKMWKQKRRAEARRFSRRFIHEEIIERNKYRQAVRFFQQYSELLDNVPFPYDVAKPIPNGTSIAAWNKVRQIICRGKVVGHNVERSTYSVDFGEDDVSQEVPDSQVATIGGPEQSRSAALYKNSSLSLLGKFGNIESLVDVHSY
jgi:hypothetical protein